MSVAWNGPTAATRNCPSVNRPLFRSSSADIVKRCSGLREFDLAALPHKKLNAVTLLQVLHLRRNCRLANIQRARGGGEATVLRYGVERTEVRENYSHSQ